MQRLYSFAFSMGNVLKREPYHIFNRVSLKYSTKILYLNYRLKEGNATDNKDVRFG